MAKRGGDSRAFQTEVLAALARIEQKLERVRVTEPGEPRPAPAAPAPVAHISLPSDVYIAQNQLVRRVDIDNPGTLDWAELSVEIRAGEVRRFKLHGLGGVIVDGKSVAWANYGDNGRLFLESGGDAAFHKRPWGWPDGWCGHWVRLFELEASTHLHVPAAAGAFDVEAQVALIRRVTVERYVVFAIGSSAEEERRDPQHSVNLGWQYRRGRGRFSVAGKVYEVELW